MHKPAPMLVTRRGQHLLSPSPHPLPFPVSPHPFPIPNPTPSSTLSLISPIPDSQIPHKSSPALPSLPSAPGTPLPLVGAPALTFWVLLRLLLLVHGSHFLQCVRGKRKKQKRAETPPTPPRARCALPPALPATRPPW